MLGRDRSAGHRSISVRLGTLPLDSDRTEQVQISHRRITAVVTPEQFSIPDECNWDSSPTVNYPRAPWMTRSPAQSRVPVEWESVLLEPRPSLLTLRRQASFAHFTRVYHPGSGQRPYGDGTTKVVSGCSLGCAGMPPSKYHKAFDHAS